MLGLKETFFRKLNNSAIFRHPNLPRVSISNTEVNSKNLLEEVETLLYSYKYFVFTDTSVEESTQAAELRDLGSSNTFYSILYIIQSTYYSLVNSIIIIPSIILKLNAQSGGKLTTSISTKDGRIWHTIFTNLIDQGGQTPLYVYEYTAGQTQSTKPITSKAYTWVSSFGDMEVYRQKKRIFQRYQSLCNSQLFYVSDAIYLYVYTRGYLATFRFVNNFRINKFTKQISWNSYAANQTSLKVRIDNSINTTLLGLKAIWLAVRYWIVGIIVFCLSFFYFLHLKSIPVNKTLFGFFIISTFFYWWISGFVFFIKKYQYSKFVSVIQRFWKRTFIIFWMLEGMLVACFLFLLLNAADEPVYMYDQIKVYKTHLFSWRWFLVKLLPAILLIILGFYLQMSVRWSLFNRQSYLITVITALILYILWIEFYQFYNVVSYYGNFYWNYDYDEFLWSLELDDRRNRICNNYVSICLIAKFAHIVFMLVFWIFFILRVNELRRVRYPLATANVQNFVILYFFSWVYMYPWIKFLLRKHLEAPYYWFNLSFRRSGLRVLLLDIKLHILSVYNTLTGSFTLSNYKYATFYYWYESGVLTSFSGYRKSSLIGLVSQTISHSVI